MWQHVNLSEQIRPWDTLACCWDVKQATHKPTNCLCKQTRLTLLPTLIIYWTLQTLIIHCSKYWLIQWDWQVDVLMTSLSCSIDFLKSGWRVRVCWLLSIPATCECISGTDLLRQFYVLPHCDRSCRSNYPSHPVTVYWHRADQSQHWPYNARRLAG